VEKILKKIGKVALIVGWIWIVKFMSEKIRPTGIAILAVFQVFAGIFIFIFWGIAGFSYAAAGIPFFLMEGIIGIILGPLGIIIGWGLWTLRSWARSVAVYMIIIGIILNLIMGVYVTSQLANSGYFGASIGGFAIQIIYNLLILLYLNSKNVKKYFSTEKTTFGENVSLLIKELPSISDWNSASPIQSHLSQEKPTFNCPKCGNNTQPEWVKCPFCKADLKLLPRDGTQEEISLCPNCGKPIETTWIKCPYCNFSLQLTCPNCGKIVQKDWKVCPYCNHKLAQDQCQSCGKKLEKEWKSCPYCGTKTN
jgi:hypothetical protein